VSQDVVLTDLRSNPLTLTHLAVSSPHLSARVTEHGRNALGHWTCKIRLDVAADCPEGRHVEALAIYTSDPDYRELRVPITLVKRRRPRLTATPGRVELRREPGQAAAARLVRLADRQGERVVIEAVTADDPALTCSWAAGPENCATVKMQVERAR